MRIYALTNTEIEQTKMIEAHDHEVICLAYSPMIKDGYWLASGSRDKNILVFDSKNNYEAVTALEHHTSTITSVQFNADGDQISLLSGSADKTIVERKIDMAAVRNAKQFEDLQLINSLELFREGKKQQCSNKVFSMDISCEYMVTGHDKQLSFWQMPSLNKVWEQEQPEVQLRTYLDPTASIVISSSTDKSVTIYEAATGRPLARCSNGEITTAMCLS